MRFQKSNMSRVEILLFIILLIHTTSIRLYKQKLKLNSAMFMSLCKKKKLVTYLGMIHV